MKTENFPEKNDDVNQKFAVFTCERNILIDYFENNGCNFNDDALYTKILFQ